MYNSKMKELFEEWIQASIPDFDESLLESFHAIDGYADETVCALFVGFCAGVNAS